MALQGPHQVAKQSRRTVSFWAMASLYSSGLFSAVSIRVQPVRPARGGGGSGNKHVRLEVVDGHLGRSVVKLADILVKGWSAEIASQRGLDG